MKQHGRLTIVSILSLAVIGLSSGLCLLRAGLADSKRARETPQFYIAGRGNPLLNLSDGRDVMSVYAGADEVKQALEQNQAEPLSLGTGDFDEDGVPDLVSGYAARSRGIVTLHRGNVDSIYANSPEAKGRKASGEFVDSPFLPQARSFELAEPAEFIATGDFDADGHLDVVTASRGSKSLYLMRGDGRGGLGEAARLEVAGEVTAMTCGEINRADGLTDVVVGILAPDGPKALVFEGPQGAMNSAPDVFAAPSEISSLALARLDDDYTSDLAIAAGRELVIVYGRDRRLSSDETRWAEAPPATLSRQSFPFTITAIAAGNFSGHGRTELALLADDGGLGVVGRTGRAASRQLKSKRTSSSNPNWQVELMASGRWPGARHLIRAHTSASTGDDLIIVDSSGHQLHVLTSEEEASSPAALRVRGDVLPRRLVTVSLPVEGEPMAVLSMRLNRDASSDLVVLRKGRSTPTTVVTAAGMSFTVTSTDDSGPGSFRQAIVDANANPGLDTIDFNIPGTGPHTITPLSVLPSINGSVILDGTTQPGFAGTPVIELNGINVIDNGLVLFGTGSTIRGLAINRFGGHGIQVDVGGNNILEGNFFGTDTSGTIALGMINAGGLVSGSSNNTIGGTTVHARNIFSGNQGTGLAMNFSSDTIVQGNFIGVDVTGTASLSNGGGVAIAAGSNNMIGGATSSARNVISGNPFTNISIFADGNLVQGNFIGTDATGTAAITNSINGVVVTGSDNLVGGTSPQAGNVVSGNSQNGVIVGVGSGNLIQGNLIGTDVTGLVALGNNIHGLSISNGTNNLIGGTTATARNVISGNGGNGIFVSGNTATENLIQGNYIGTDVSGTIALGNSNDAVAVFAPGNIIGGDKAGAGNLISGNASGGIRINGNTATGNLVQGNLIGTDVTGTAPLPNIGIGVFVNSASNNIIGGTTPEARNVISANLRGVEIDNNGATGNQVIGNFIGTDISGTAGLGNTFEGVIVFRASGNMIGGTASGARNVISGNRDNGIAILSGTSTGNLVQGNFIGTQADGTSPLGNASHGVILSGNLTSGFASNNTIGGMASGAANTIAFNGLTGVTILSGTGDAVLSNSIFSNDGLGIDLGGNGVTANDAGDADTGANNLQNFPLLTATVSSIQGTLNSAANTTFRVEFFLNTACDPSGFGEGQTLIGTTDVTTDGGGNGAFNFAASLSLGQRLTATATDPNGNTSEFSQCIQVAPPALSINDVNVTEGNAGTVNAVFTVSLSAATSADVTVNFATADGTATVDSDYFSASGVLTIPGNTLSGGITVQIKGDTLFEPGETFSVNLSNPVNASIADGQGIGTITNDDIAAPTTFVVINVNNSGAGSLRQAIIDANANPALDTIVFNIGSGVQTIAPASTLPAIADPVIIDGTTQPGFAGTPIIELNGANAGVNVHGLSIIAGGSTVRGLVINRFSQHGIQLMTSGGNTIKGCYIGTDVTGAIDLGNTGIGIFINGVPNNRIGGSSNGERNVISGNNSDGIALTNVGATGNVVQGNFIGANSSGTSLLGNAFIGISFFNAPGNTIGGVAAGTGNVISGNGTVSNEGNGIEIQGSLATGNIIQGNLIGTDITGTFDLGNTFDGIFVSGAANTIIGGISPGARNIISGNNGVGVELAGNVAGTIVQGNLIGTNSAGAGALGNSRDGVVISVATGVTIGGTTTGAGNVISGNLGNGVAISLSSSTGNVVQGNLIGTDITGTVDLGNSRDGVNITGASNLIGGAVTGARNVISGNNQSGIAISGVSATGNIIQGNFIGTDVNGSADLGNSIHGVSVTFAPNTLIGGTAAEVRNIISGNTGNGVFIFGATATGNLVQGNFIGTSVTGTTALQNSQAGVSIDQASGNTVGGGAAGARNVISGNRFGVEIVTNNATENIVQGNLIGTDASGGASLGNSLGVLITGATNNLIGGTAAGAGNIISGNNAFGIQFDGLASGNLVQGNFIGTTSNGAAALGNTNGITIGFASNNTIGGTVAEARNVISGNRADGIAIIFASSTGNLVQGNLIGTQVDGASPLGNGSRGVVFSGSATSGFASNNTIGGTGGGAGNMIAFNGGAGVLAISGTGNRVLSNSIFSNGGLGIDLGGDGVTLNDPGDGDTGSNALQNFPTLTSASGVGANATIRGNLNSTSNTTFRIEFFSNTDCDLSGFGEGQIFVGSCIVTTDNNGDANFSCTFPVTLTTGQAVTATATGPSDDTSEFSQCVLVNAVNTPASTQPVTVQAGSVTITFASVSAGGITVAVPIAPSLAGQLPGGFDPGTAIAFDITTTATVVGPIVVCFNLPLINDPAVFANLRVLHNEGGTLVDRTILPPDSPAPDFATRTICARVVSLSPFVIARLINRPPVAKCKNIVVAADSSCTARISPSDIDNGSFDPDASDTISLAIDSTGSFGLGTHTVILTVTDSHSASISCSTTVTVVDNTSPSITGVLASPSVLWPPNHKMVDVMVSYNASDNCGSVSCSLSVTSNEPVNGAGDGDTAPDWEIVDAHHVRLRAERAGSGNGRIYAITITCTDSSGNTASESVTVTVPHNR